MIEMVYTCTHAGFWGDDSGQCNTANKIILGIKVYFGTVYKDTAAPCNGYVKLVTH